MKKSLFISSKALIPLLIAAAPLAAQAQRNWPPRPNHDQWPMPAFTAIYSGVSSNDQLVTPNFGEGAPTYQYKFDPIFYTAQNQIPGAAQMQQIYRCFATSGNYHHFASTANDCEGNRNEGSYGWVFKNQAPGLVAVYRFFSRSRGYHMITANPADVRGTDFYSESILGYAFPPNQMTNPVPIPSAAYADWVPVFAATGGIDHFLTLNFGEGAPTYEYSGIAFYVLSNASFSNGTPTTALYRCFDNHHFASTSANCEGHRVEGQYGYVYTTQQFGTVPLYRYFSRETGTHWITTNPSEVSKNFYPEGILGYVAR